jgi:hypothetical protein
MDSRRAAMGVGGGSEDLAKFAIESCSANSKPPSAEGLVAYRGKATLACAYAIARADSSALGQFQNLQ